MNMPIYTSCLFNSEIRVFKQWDSTADSEDHSEDTAREDTASVWQFQIPKPQLVLNIFFRKFCQSKATKVYR